MALLHIVEYGKLTVTNRLAMLTHSRLSTVLTSLMLDLYLQEIQEDCFIHNRSLLEKKDQCMFQCFQLFATKSGCYQIPISS